MNHGIIVFFLTVKKNGIILVGLVVLLCLVAKTIFRHPKAQPVLNAKPFVQPVATSVTKISPVAAVSEPPVPADTTVVPDSIPSQPPITNANIPPADNAVKIAHVKKGSKAKQPIQDLVARAALSFVGADPDANEYWVAAINDPALSAEERKDLIEDLNEEGLSNPKNPGEEDIPLIVSRIELIEYLAPNAMDQVNYDAFVEAYKDLNDMLEGKPIK